MHTINNLFFLLFQPHKLKFKKKREVLRTSFLSSFFSPLPPLGFSAKGKQKKEEREKEVGNRRREKFINECFSYLFYICKTYAGGKSS